MSANPCIDLVASVSSTIYKRAERASFFKITLTATLQYNIPITILRRHTILRSLQTLPEGLEIIDEDTEEVVHGYKVDRKELFPSLSWDEEDSFLTLYPGQPHDVHYTLGPFARTVRDYTSKISFYSREAYECISDLPPRNQYTLRLVEGQQINWWRQGTKEDLLQTRWGAKLWGPPEQTEPLPAELKIPLHLKHSDSFEFDDDRKFGPEDKKSELDDKSKWVLVSSDMLNRVLQYEMARGWDPEARPQNYGRKF